MLYSRYWKYLPERIKLYLSHPDWAIQDSRVNHLLSLLTTYDMLGIDANFYELANDTSELDIYGIDWNHYDSFLSSPKEAVSNRKK